MPPPSFGWTRKYFDASKSNKPGPEATGAPTRPPDAVTADAEDDEVADPPPTGGGGGRGGNGPKTGKCGTAGGRTPLPVGDTTFDAEEAFDGAFPQPTTFRGISGLFASRMDRRVPMSTFKAEASSLYACSAAIVFVCATMK